MKTKSNMKKLSEYILYVAKKQHLEIPKSKLNKVLYFVVKELKNLLDEQKFTKLYDEPFLVWISGPIVKSVNDDKYIKEENYQEFHDYNDLITKYLTKREMDLVSNDLFNDFWCKNRDCIVLGKSKVSYNIEDV